MNESIELAFVEGSSDKVYQAELVEESSGWIVKFAYGRRGNTLNTGTKTKTPLEYAKAKKVYDKLIASKRAKGYKGDGEGAAINTTVRADVGVRPQLLNEIEEDKVHLYIMDDGYCMQEKFDGRRKMIKKRDGVTQGANKKGLAVPLTPDFEAELTLINKDFIFDGEDMGDYMMLFDELSFPNATYKERYDLLEACILRFCSNSLKRFVVVKTAWTREEKQLMYDELKASNAEGVVFKIITAPYYAGRPASGGSQFKCKFYATASCIVATHNSTKRSISVNVLDSNGNTVDIGNVTVYPNQSIPPIGSVVEIKYLYYFQGGSLYQPVLLNVRDDVYPQECLMTQLKRKQS